MIPLHKHTHTHSVVFSGQQRHSISSLPAGREAVDKPGGKQRCFFSQKLSCKTLPKTPFGSRLPEAWTQVKDARMYLSGLTKSTETVEHSRIEKTEKSSLGNLVYALF